MRRLALSLILGLLALATLPGVASAAHSQSPGPPQDFAVGTGKTRVIGVPANAAEREFSVSAHRNPNGDVRGFANYRMITFTGESINSRGHVECLDVRGNRAAVLGRFEAEPPFGPIFPNILLFVEDNGEPSDPVPDRGLATALGSSDGLPPTCPPVPFFSFLASGAPPLRRGT